MVNVVTIAGHELWLEFKSTRAWPRCGSWDVAGRLDTFAIRSAERDEDGRTPSTEAQLFKTECFILVVPKISSTEVCCEFKRCRHPGIT